MKWRSVLGHALLGGFVSIFAFGFLFPAILNPGFLFGALVALLVTGGSVMVAITAREVFRR